MTEEVRTVSTTKKILPSDGSNFVQIYTPGLINGVQASGYLVSLSAFINISSITEIPEYPQPDTLESDRQADYRYLQLIKNVPFKILGFYSSINSNEKIQRDLLTIWHSAPGYKENLLPRLTDYEALLVSPGETLWARIESPPDVSALGGSDQVSISATGFDWIPDNAEPEITQAIPFGATATTTSSVIVPANSARKLVTIINRTGQTCFINFGSTATANAGIGLNPGGSAYTFNTKDINYRGAISAITSSGTATLEIMEAS